MEKYFGISNYQLVLALILLAHVFLAVRYAVKAVLGQVEHYSFLKMAMVVFLPFIGYYLATKEEPVVS